MSKLAHHAVPVLVLLLCSLPVQALAALRAQDRQSIDSAVQEAETLVKKGDFAEAAQAYQQAIDAGARCATMYYNQGTAALKAGQIGPAVLSLERGLRLDPDDEDLRYNLRQALGQIRGPLAEAALMPRPQAWLLRLPLRTWQQLALVVWAVALVLMLLRVLLMSRWPWLRHWGLALALSVFVAAFVSSALSFERQKISRRGDAVMIAAKPQAAREADDPHAPTAFVVQPGQPLQIVGRGAGWMRVELLNGLQAWLPADSLQEIQGDQSQRSAYGQSGRDLDANAG